MGAMIAFFLLGIFVIGVIGFFVALYRLLAKKFTAGSALLVSLLALWLWMATETSNRVGAVAFLAFVGFCYLFVLAVVRVFLSIGYLSENDFSLKRRRR